MSKLFVFVLILFFTCSKAFQSKLTLTHGFIASQNYSDGFYPDNLKEEQELIVKKGYKIVLYFIDFGIEETGGNRDIWKEFVELIDGKTNRSMAKMCGNSYLSRPYSPVLRTQKFISTGNTMIVRMVTDFNNQPVPEEGQLMGFKAHYYAEDIDECEENMLGSDEQSNSIKRCSQVCINYAGSFSCECYPGFQLSEDGMTCKLNPKSCPSIPKGSTSGYVVPPMFRNAYAPFANCTWSLYANPGENIHLSSVADFDVEEATNCDFDYVEVEDQSGLNKLCGQRAVKNFKSATDWMRIKFVSDGTNERSGFKFQFSSLGVRCRLPEPPLYGFFIQAPSKSSDGYSYIGYGQKIKIKCQDGFWLFGSSKLSCLKDGSLNPRLPKCLAL